MPRGPNAKTPRRHRKAPKLAAAELAPPRYLSADARAEWNRLAPELRAAGLLTVGDVAALAGYCESYSEFVALSKAIAKAKPADRVKLYSVRSVTINRLSALGRALGLSPRARANMQGQDTPPPPSTDGEATFEDFIA